MKIIALLLGFFNLIYAINGYEHIQNIKLLKFYDHKYNLLYNKNNHSEHYRSQMQCWGSCLCNEIKIKEIECQNMGKYPESIISHEIDTIMWKCRINDIIGFKLSNISILCNHDYYMNEDDCVIDYTITPLYNSKTLNQNLHDIEYTYVNYSLCFPTAYPQLFCTGMGRMFLGIFFLLGFIYMIILSPICK